MKTKKRKLNIKKMFILILFLYLIGCSSYYVYKKPIQNIIITGNVYVKDVQIIELAKIKDYPSIFSINIKNMQKSIKKEPMIDEVLIKRNLKFQLKINITEAKMVLLNTSNNNLILSNGKSIPNTYNYQGIPTLINYTSEKVLKKFSLGLGEVDLGIIGLINEIEYSPTMSEEGVSLDEERFILYMNDGNTVYTNAEKCSTLNHYKEIYASLNGKKGILNLDSGNSENFVFTSY
ncbi:MAG: FtsQ-type POTRA domain-containing protein [Bacilli bacterium]|nr:FtsQ-type POTRA domain-containing protein [Bacilli bacterium]